MAIAPGSAAERYLPMRFLLDDEDLRAVDPGQEIFRKARRERRRIYLAYATEFRRESRQLLRLRLRQIAGRSEWEALLPLMRGSLRHLSISAGFYAAWMAHGLGLKMARGITARALRGVELSLAV